MFATHFGLAATTTASTTANFKKVTADWLEEHEEELGARREALKAETGQNPHPGVLVYDCARRLPKV